MPAKRSAKLYLLFVIPLLIIAVFCYLLYALVPWKEDHIDTGYNNEARRNPFLAAELFLQARGVEAQTTRKFSVLDYFELNGEEIGAEDTIILFNGRGIIKGKRFERLWNWIDRGGNLVISTENPFVGATTSDDLLEKLSVDLIQPEDLWFDDDADYADFAEEPNDTEDDLHDSEEDQTDTEENVEQIQKIDFEKILQAAAQADNCPSEVVLTEVEFSNEATPLKVHYQPDNYMQVYGDVEPSALINDDYGTVIAYYQLGEGSVYLSVDNTVWHNRAIHCFDHAYLLWKLINPEAKVWFVINTETASLASIIWAASPIGVIVALLSLLGWLWRNGVRLGPVFRPAALERRSFAEHLHANSIFLWRNHRHQVLISRLRKDLAPILTRRIAGFDKMNQQQKLEQITKLTQVSNAAVSQALLQPITPDRPAFTAAIKTLKKIKERL